jgi:hypothetical protein
MEFIKTAKQKEAIRIIAKNKTTLLEGGSRSGKTFIVIYAMVIRAFHYANTWHVAARLRFNHAKTSLWMKTIPDVIKKCNLEKYVEYNSSDFYLEFPNKSRLLVAGLDDKERVEKILGNEYATIFLNEASQISYDSYEIVKTRLNPPKGIPARFLIDYNPPSIKHWGYNVFHKRKFPDGKPVPDNDYAVIKINPRDNIENLSEDYIPELESLSGNRRKRFLDGEYTTEEGSLWKRDWIKYRKPSDTQLTRVVVGVDPSGSKTGDEIGIIVAGKGADNNYYILGDYSLHGTPKEWAEEVLHAYKNNSADVVSAEKNYGGEMVQATITQMGTRNINVQLVNATRGKVVRAEPISALYEQGLVFHSDEYPALEDELCTTRFEDLEKSPNRLDALVWAMTELCENNFDFNVRVI